MADDVEHLRGVHDVRKVFMLDNKLGLTELIRNMPRHPEDVSLSIEFDIAAIAELICHHIRAARVRNIERVCHGAAADPFDSLVGADAPIIVGCGSGNLDGGAVHNLEHLGGIGESAVRHHDLDLGRDSGLGNGPVDGRPRNVALDKDLRIVVFDIVNIVGDGAGRVDADP